jgi:hypothetical protein
MEHESDPTAVTESLLNRMDYSQGTIRQGLHSGFYGPVNRGLLPGRMAQLQRDHARMERINRGIDEALGGSNLLQGATDQGSGNDPNAHWPGGRIMRRGEIYNDWGSGPGGHAGAAAFRERQQRALREGRPYPFTQEQFGPPAPEKDSLLDDAKGAGVFGKIEGSANLTVDFQNMPRGVKHRTSAEGLFKEVRVNRGSPMALASEDG